MNLDQRVYLCVGKPKKLNSTVIYFSLCLSKIFLFNLKSNFSSLLNIVQKSLDDYVNHLMVLNSVSGIDF